MAGRTAARLTRHPALVAAVGFLVLGAASAVAARAGVSQDVVLPHWWIPWTHRLPGRSLGWVAAELLLLGAACALWIWLGRSLLDPADGDDAEPDEPGPQAPGTRSRWSLRAGVAVATAWSLPLLVTGPMGSLDVQSYAAIGRLAALGLDPYHATPGWLVDGYGAAVDPLWRWTPSPYGPVQIALVHGLVQLAGAHVLLAVLLLRGAAVLGVAWAVWLAVRAVPPRERLAVLLLTALSPVVLIHVVSGAHLDAVVGGLAVLVVGLVYTGRPAVAMAVAVFACFLKLPGAVLVGFVGLFVLRSTPRPALGRALLRVLAAGLAALVAVVALFPDPFGWVGALDVPGLARPRTAPSTWISYLLAAVTGQPAGHGASGAFTVGRLLTELAGTAIAFLLLWRAAVGDRRAAFRGVGWALVVVAMTGPTVYPWYLTWGLFAAAIGSGLAGRVALVALGSALVVASALGTNPLVVTTCLSVLAAVLALSAWLARQLLGERPRHPAPVAPAGEGT